MFTVPNLFGFEPKAFFPNGCNLTKVILLWENTNVKTHNKYVKLSFIEDLLTVNDCKEILPKEIKNNALEKQIR